MWQLFTVPKEPAARRAAVLKKAKNRAIESKFDCEKPDTLAFENSKVSQNPKISSKFLPWPKKNLLLGEIPPKHDFKYFSKLTNGREILNMFVAFKSDRKNNQRFSSLSKKFFEISYIKVR